VDREARARRLLAFTGALPLGAFLVLHLVAMSTALGGAARFERVVSQSGLVSFSIVLFVVLPFVFHAGYGAYVATLRPETMSRATWWPGARRFAALGALVFLVAHVAELPLREYTGALRPEAVLDVLVAHVSSTTAELPLVALAYLAGLGLTLFHFATSTWTFVTEWSVVVTPRAQRVTAWSLAAGASLLFLVGANTIVFLATGKRLVGPTPSAFVPDGPAPAPCRPNP
jgi:succinate dehydrogenase / fumarate reductase cytochrome b subunit